MTGIPIGIAHRKRANAKWGQMIADKFNIRFQTPLSEVPTNFLVKILGGTYQELREITKSEPSSKWAVKIAKQASLLFS